MQDLIDAGILDLGGEGTLLLEIEYKNTEGEFKEVIFRLPEIINKHDIASATMFHMPYNHVRTLGRAPFDGAATVLQLTVTDVDTFNVYLPDRCAELIEVRLPEAVGGDNITDMFV